ncbi:DNA mismatch repair protein pms1 [Taphrina deformans PYCC 5710]|uniref:DNA mismatch repair protein pms1 n=1 Tax=Taphrina deformans (strain PYCC 5710 / ATCC 11124 / CBS 356.35 / IMI 108563 / JCM 9778 / NBRC 8474) TaxID=1097556 RepID=R4XCI7_TAPDE|nr:DNA mismatch repair protein pms1 [Taphrina deformans PYCC 5710]|eukprot:CCG82066.1 DNA mismatch repair protein pms1 [Taphrina deformans PYCC 5710]
MTHSLRAIPRTDVNLIQSAQVITCLRDAAKELLENAIDAGAKKISLKFTNYGMEALEVTDDGTGIAEEDFDTLVAKHATSKLQRFDDLEKISTLGFRGEALSSLCALSTMSITTCTKATYPLGHHLKFARDGTILEKKTVSAQVGTTVRVQELFSSLPVRRKDFEKNAKKDFISATKSLQAHAAIQVGVRVEAIHFNGKNKNHLLGSHGTTGSHDLRRNICDIFGSQLHKLLIPIEKETNFQSTDRRRLEMTVVKFRGFVSDIQKEYGQRPERQLTYINSRPCHLPKILRTINETCATLGSNRPPFVLLELSMPPDSYDVNVSPDKRTIFLHDEQVILESLREAIIEKFSTESRFIPISRLITQSSHSTKMTQSSLQSLSNFSSPWKDGSQAPEQPSWDISRTSSPAPERTMIEVVANRKAARANDGQVVDRSQVDVHSDDENKDDPVETLQKQINTDQNAQDTSIPSTSSLMDFSYDSTSPGAARTRAESLKRKRSPGLSSGSDIKVRPTTLSMRESTPKIPSDQNSENTEHQSKDFDILMQPDDDTTVPNIEQRTELPIERDTATTATESSIPKNTPIVPLQRFVKRLNNFEHSNTALHVHHLQTVLDSSLAMEVPVSDSASQLHEGPDDRTSTQLQNAGIDDTPELAERMLSLSVSKSDFFGMTVVGQFNLGFIIVLRHQELFIIDQHASDEKSNYEKLLRNTIIQSQRLAVPRELELSAIERLSLGDHLETLARNGFEIASEECDDGEVRFMLEALPVTKNITFDEKDLLEILHLLMEGSPVDSVRCTKAKRMFASRACRSSIMIGTALSHDKMQAVVWHLGEMDAPWNCPHGRPTMRHLLNISDMPKFIDGYP